MLTLNNFGQQPFAGSNVTDNGDHTVTIGGTVYNKLQQTWQQYARTALGYTQDRVAALENLVKQRDIQIADLRSDFAAIVARIESIEADHVNMMDNSNGSNSY